MDSIESYCLDKLVDLFICPERNFTFYLRSTPMRDGTHTFIIEPRWSDVLVMAIPPFQKGGGGFWKRFNILTLSLANFAMPLIRWVRIGIAEII